MRKRSANVAAANVLSVRKQSDSNNKSGSSDAPRKLCSARKRSVSGKAPSRNGNQPHVMVVIHILTIKNY
ncbi:hypothetical protein [Lysinibacillus xylanilyticus]|uniref:hypothetical protein n=1 Tax=Lysinibacillus xylanilyticus TaxID=582475 RepID=UPI0038283B06